MLFKKFNIELLWNIVYPNFPQIFVESYSSLTKVFSYVPPLLSSHYFHLQHQWSLSFIHWFSYLDKSLNQTSKPNDCNTWRSNLKSSLSICHQYNILQRFDLLIRCIQLVFNSLIFKLYPWWPYGWLNGMAFFIRDFWLITTPSKMRLSFISFYIRIPT